MSFKLKIYKRPIRFSLNNLKVKTGNGIECCCALPYPRYLKINFAFYSFSLLFRSLLLLLLLFQERLLIISMTDY